MEFEDSIEEIDLENLNEDQSQIDSVLKFLLSYNAPKKSVLRPRKNVAKKGENTMVLNPNENSDEAPVSVPEDLRECMKKVSNINDLHPGLLMEYLVKLNEFNKKILQSVGVLHKKYCELKLVQSSASLTTKGPTVGTKSSDNVETLPVTPKDEIIRPNNAVQLETRVDAIEQKSNADVILCSGAVIKDVMEAMNSNHDSDLKENILSTIKRALPGKSEVDEIVRVSPFGKKKTHVKVVCSSIEVRKKLIAYARREKPENIYFSEFLTSYRNGLFYSLRSLRNRFRDRISAVYVRDGNIYYKLHDTDGFKSVRTQLDITNLEKKLTESE